MKTTFGAVAWSSEEREFRGIHMPERYRDFAVLQDGPRHALCQIMRCLLMAIGLSLSLVGCMADDPTSRRQQDGCHIGGCSSQICSDRSDIVSTCEWIDAYACYQDATCERQVDGACGWTATPELDACLASH
jgi:hypothetical protein